MISGCCLLVTICFLILGGIFKVEAEQYEGVSVQMGYMSNGQFHKTDSGNIAGNSQAVEEYNLKATGCFIFSGLSGIFCIIAFIDDKKSQKLN